MSNSSQTLMNKAAHGGFMADKKQIIHMKIPFADHSRVVFLFKI